MTQGDLHELYSTRKGLEGFLVRSFCMFSY